MGSCLPARYQSTLYGRCLLTKRTGDQKRPLACERKLIFWPVFVVNSILFHFAKPNRKHFNYKRQILQQIVEGVPIDNHFVFKVAFFKGRMVD